MVKLSKRLKAVAAMITPGYRVCDVGTDHAYIPIHLVETGKCTKVLAMDLREGPLERAKSHIQRAGLEGKIETRISDGICNLGEDEADSVVIAGMGGEVILHILKADADKFRNLKELILQPQSDVEKVRRYLRLNGFKIMDEDMVLEDGKYYPMFRLVPVDENPFWDKIPSGSKKVCDLYGPMLISNGNSNLRKFLVKENRTLRQIKEELSKQELTETIEKRLKEVDKQLLNNEAAYSIMGEIKNAGL